MKRDPYRPEAPTLRWLWAITLAGLFLAAVLAFDVMDADASTGCEVLYVKTDHHGTPYVEDDEQVTRWGPDVGAWVPHEIHDGYRWTRTDQDRGCGTTTTLEPTTTVPETTTTLPPTTLPPVLPADPCSVWPEECADREDPAPLPVPEKDPVPTTLTVEPERTAATLPVTGPSEDRDRRIQKLVDAGLLLLVVGVGLGFVAADNKRRRA